MDFVENLNYKNEKNKSSYSLEKKNMELSVLLIICPIYIQKNPKIPINNVQSLFNIESRFLYLSFYFLGITS